MFATKSLPNVSSIKHIYNFVPSTLEKVNVTAPGQEVEGQGDGVVGYVPDTDLEALASCVDEITRVYTLADSLIVSPCSNSTCSPILTFRLPDCEPLFQLNL